MGIEFSWKKIRKYLWKIIFGAIAIVGLIAAIITIATNWEAVSNWLSSIENPLANPIVRESLLWILIAGVIIWLILINGKIKKLSQSIQEKAKVKPETSDKKEKIEEKKIEKKEPEPKLSEEHICVLLYISESSSSIGEAALYEIYKKKYPNSLRTDMRSIISDLLKIDYIHQESYFGDASYYKAKEKGIRFIKKILEKSREKKNSTKD